VGEVRDHPACGRSGEHIPRPQGQGIKGKGIKGKGMAKVSPFKFFQEVRSETQKVTWPTRREVMITTIMVFVMVILAGIFFSVSDQVIRYVVTLVLGIGS
jgi:preprotein translocase subunit SecE